MHMPITRRIRSIVDGSLMEVESSSPAVVPFFFILLIFLFIYELIQLYCLNIIHIQFKIISAAE